MRFNNANVDLANINDEVTFHKGSGTSTTTNIYLDLDHDAEKVHIDNDKAFVVVAINGQDFTDPKTVSAAKGFSIARTVVGDFIDSIKIRASEATSHFEVMMW